MKVCDPAGPNAAEFCQHIYDRIGCAYNAPNTAPNGVFQSCEGDNQDYPGVYTDSTGAVQTYTQPPESLGAIQTMPYQPKVPSSSNCVTYSAKDLYASAAAAYPSASPAASSANATATGTVGSATGKVNAATGSRTGTAANVQETGSATNAGSAVQGSLLTIIGAFAITALVL